MKWETQQSICNIKEKDTDSQIKVILGRVQFHRSKVGCCGKIRNDEIYPIGYTCKFEDFKVDAIKTVNEFDVDKNIYSVEYFEGDSLSDFRGFGMSLYFLINKNNKWEFYINGNFQFSKTKEEIINEWGNQV